MPKHAVEFKDVNMKRLGLLLIAIIIGASLAFILSRQLTHENPAADEFYFGASYGGPSVQDAKNLVDKVKGYTNFFLISSWDISTNETALNEICDYTANSGLNFMVYFDFISRIAYPWHQTWLDNASTRWGDKFLGIYLMDEPGGKQIDTQKYFTNASNYSDAADRFVSNITLSNSMIDAKSKNLTIHTSDYALYWWDYQAGYDVLFAELGWNISSTQQIALARGAAHVQDKDWGAFIVWKYYDAPYLADASEVYDDMMLAYEGGAKYVLIFNYPTYPEGNPYGILSEEHLTAMQRFWDYINTHPRTADEGKAEAALVLPKDYGWGMRRTQYIEIDNLWGIFPEDEKTQLILNNTRSLLTTYGLKLDIIYDDPQFNYKNKYSTLYYWNSTLP